MTEKERESLLKMTKAEIIKHFEHLGSTIESKDSEINRLRDEHADEVQILKAQIKTTIEATKKEMKEKFDNDQKALLAEKESLRLRVQELESGQANVAKEANSDVVKTQRLLERRTSELNKYIAMTGALLKSIQGTTDMAISLNEEYYEKVVK